MVLAAIRIQFNDRSGRPFGRFPNRPLELAHHAGSKGRSHSIDGVSAMATRKVVQIAVCGVAATVGTQCEAILIALCDDGTMWQTDNRALNDYARLDSSRWLPVHPIPQDEPSHA